MTFRLIGAHHATEIGKWKFNVLSRFFFFFFGGGQKKWKILKILIYNFLSFIFTFFVAKFQVIYSLCQINRIVFIISFTNHATLVRCFQNLWESYSLRWPELHFPYGYSSPQSLLWLGLMLSYHQQVWWWLQVVCPAPNGEVAYQAHLGRRSK